MNKLRNKFLNLKIADKELTLIAVMSFFLVIVGFVGVYFIEQSSRKITDIYQNRLLTVQRLNSIRAHTRAIEADLYKLIITNDPVQSRQYLNDIHHRSAEWTELYSLYVNSQNESYECPKINSMNREKPQIINAQNTTIKLIQNNQKEEAYSTYQKYVPILNSFNRKLETLAAYNQGQAKEEFENYQEIRSLARMFIPLTVLFALLSALLLAFLISRLISNPIIILKDKMSQVAGGNLDIEPAQITSKDEIGELNESFNVMAGNLKELVQREQNAKDRETLLRKIITDIRNSLDINQTLQTISTQVAQIFDADIVHLVEFPDRKTFKNWKIRAIVGPSIDISKMSQEGVEYWCEKVFYATDNFIIPDVDKADIPDYYRHNCKLFSIKSIIGIPVRSGDEIWGSLSVANTQPRSWTDEEINLLYTIADQIYIAINQAELFEKTKQAADRETLLRKIIETIRTSLDINETLAIICDEVARLFNADRAVIVEFPNKQNYQEHFVRREFTAYPEIRLFREGYDPRIGVFWGENALNKGITVAIDNISDSDTPDFFKKAYLNRGINSIINVPIQKGEDKWGTLGLSMDKPKHWTRSEIELLESITGQIYLAIKQSELYSNTRKSAEREALLRRIGETIRSTLNIEETFKIVCKEIGEAFNVQRVTISQHPKDIIRAEYRARPDVKGLENLEFDERIADFWGKSLESDLDYVAADNINEAQIPDFLKDFYKSLDTKSVIGIPIKSAQEKWGGLVLAQTDSYRHWTQEDISLLITISGQIYTAISQSELFSRTKKLADREALLRTIISTVRKTLDINEIEQGIVNEVGKAFNADRCFFRVYDINTDKFLPVRTEYVSSPEVPSIIGAAFEESKYGGFKERYKQGELHIMPDLQACLNNPSYDVKGTKALIDDYNVKSNYGISIFYKDQFLGVFVLHYTKTIVQLDNDSIELLKSVADQSGIALNQAQLYAATRRNAERSGAIRRIIEAIGGSLDLNEIMNVISREMLTLFNVDRVTSATYPRAGEFTYWTGFWEVKGKAEYPDITSDNFSIESKNWLGNLMIAKIQDLIINDYNEPFLPEHFKEDHKKLLTKSSLNVPIKRGNEVWGVIGIHTIEHYHSWTQDEIELMHTIADQIFIAIRQAELYATTKQSAERESLLRTINNQILISHNIYEAVNAIVNETGKIFNVDRVVLRFYEPAIRSFSEVQGEYKKDETTPSAFAKPPYSKETNEYFIREAGEKKQILPIENIDDPKYPDFLRDTLTYLNIKSTLLAPILYGDDILGLIFLTTTENRRSWSQMDIKLLQDIAYQISIGIHLFDLTNKLSKSLDSERVVRNIIFEARDQENHDLVFDYMLKKLVETFHVERAIHLHYDEYRNLYVENEVLIDSKLESMYHEATFLAKNTKELEPKMFGETIIINDVNTEIYDVELRNFLINKNILSFIIYPKSRTYPVYEEEEIAAIVMLCFSRPKIWTQNEIDSFKLIVDATSLVYLEMRQRKEAEETRNTFLATLTHDLRSPINAEQKALEFILSRKNETQLGNFREFLEGIYTTNEELLRIVNNILGVYHYESGQFVLNLEPNNIKELIEESIRSMLPLAKADASDITSYIQADLPEIIMDRDEIKRVVTNLISNAIKHTRKGTAIQVKARKIDNCVEIAVSDNGPGIPDKEKPMIFQRYPTTKRKIGTGLGLYISKQIIDAHQGKIWFETEIGKGTTFHFTLPLVRK